MAETPPFEVQKHEDVTVVRCNETALIDTMVIEKMRNLLNDLVEHFNRTRIVVDMDNVAHMSSAALGVLIPVSNKLRKSSGTIVLAGVGDSIREVFKITKLERRFRFAPNVSAALAELDVSVQ